MPVDFEAKWKELKENKKKLDEKKETLEAQLDAAIKEGNQSNKDLIRQQLIQNQEAQSVLLKLNCSALREVTEAKNTNSGNEAGDNVPYQPAQLRKDIASTPTSEDYTNLNLGGDWALYASDNAAAAGCSYLQYEFCVFNQQFQYDAKIRPAVEACFQDFKSRVNQHANGRPSDTHLATKWEGRLRNGVESKIVTVNMVFPRWVEQSLEHCIEEHILVAGFSADGLLSAKKPVRRVRQSGKSMHSANEDPPAGCCSSSQN